MRPGTTRDFEFCSKAPFGPAVLPAGNGRPPMAFLGFRTDPNPAGREPELR